MDEKTTNQLDRLLAGGELSGPEADAIFDRVYATVAREERPRRGRRALVLAACALSAAAALPLALPWISDGEPEGRLTARGAAARGPALEVACSDGTLSACPQSAKLIFLVSGEARRSFLSAYAEPLDAGGERVWYFSREVGSPELPENGDGTRVFDRGVSLARSHRAGPYRVHAFLAERPLTREEMLAPPKTARLLQVQSHVTVVAVTD